MMWVMTWRRAENVVWVISGVAVAMALALVIQGRQDRSVMLCVVISLGVRLFFDLTKRLAGPDGTRESMDTTHVTGRD